MTTKRNEKNRLGRPLLFEKRDFTVTARLSLEKCEEFKKISHSWGLGSAQVLRRLIKYVLLEKISLVDLLHMYDKNTKLTSSKSKQLSSTSTITTRLSEKDNADFCTLSSTWDFAPGTLAKILVQYLLTLDDQEYIWHDI
jgi:hypothetical protein